MEWLLIGLILLIFFRPILMVLIWVGTFFLFLFGLFLGIGGLLLAVIFGKKPPHIRTFGKTSFQWPDIRSRSPKRNRPDNDVIDVEVKRIIKDEDPLKEKPPADRERSTGGH